MAKDEQTGPTPSDEPVEDLRGEDLASPLPEGVTPEPYEIVADETEAEELTETGDDDVIVSDPEQLEAATEEAKTAVSTRPKKVSSAVVDKKGVATPRQAKKGPAEENRKRVGPFEFIKQCAEELKKVVWPTGEQLSQYFVVVLVFVLFIIAYVSALDLGFGALLMKLLG